MWRVIMGLLVSAFAVVTLYFLPGLIRQNDEHKDDASARPTPSETASRAQELTLETPLPAPPQSPALTAGKNFAPLDLRTVTDLMAKFNTGDYLGAVTVADQAAVNPQLTATFQQWLREQMPAILISAGWIKIKLGECDEGVRLLTRAEGFRRTLESAKGLAYCHHKLGNIAAADEHFQHYFEMKPEDPDLLRLYADALESQGRFAEAVQSLEAAMTHSDGEQKKTAEQRLAAMRLRSKESRSQTTDSSRNFIITYRSGDHEDLVAVVLETLEQALDEYIEDYGYKEPLTRLEVVLYPFEQFRGIVAGGPEWAEGVFDGRLRIPVKLAQVRARDYLFLKMVLRHELVHALNAQMSGGRGLPPWFEEGLAQRLSCPRTGCGKFAFPPTPGTFLPLASFSSSYLTLDAVAAGQAYRQSLYIIYTLESMKTGEDVLRSMIRAVHSSGSLDSDAVLNPAGLTFAEVHKQAADWWAERVFKYQK